MWWRAKLTESQLKCKRGQWLPSGVRVAGCFGVREWIPSLHCLCAPLRLAITQSLSFVAHQLLGRHVFSFGASRSRKDALCQVLGEIVTSQEVAGDVIDS